MAHEEGLVASIGEDGWAQVITRRSDACAECGAARCCASLGSSSKMVTRALNRAGAGVGDLVAVKLRAGAVVQSAIALYLIPVLGLIAGGVAGAGLHRELPFGETAATILFSFVGLSLGFLITALISRWMFTSNRLTPVITRIKKPGLGIPETLIALDPVCNMPLDPAEAAASFVYRDKTYYFCHSGCKETFAKEPERYL